MNESNSKSSFITSVIIVLYLYPRIYDALLAFVLELNYYFFRLPFLFGVADAPFGRPRSACGQRT